jgi:ABC-type polysaccharide/polyol phosphate export permease
MVMASFGVVDAGITIVVAIALIAVASVIFSTAVGKDLGWAVLFVLLALLVVFCFGWIVAGGIQVMILAVREDDGWYFVAALILFLLAASGIVWVESEWLDADIRPVAALWSILLTGGVGYLLWLWVQ